MRWKRGYRDLKSSGPSIGRWLKRVKERRTCRGATVEWDEIKSSAEELYKNCTEGGEHLTDKIVIMGGEWYIQKVGSDVWEKME